MLKITYIVLTCDSYIKTRCNIVNETWRNNIDLTDKFYFLSSTPDLKKNILGYYDPDDYIGAPIKKSSLFIQNTFDTDWIFICDDDTYVFPDRLKTLLKKYNNKLDLCVCRVGNCAFNPNNFNINFPVTFPSGGAGFAITNSLFTKIKNYLSSIKPIPHSLNGDVSFGVWARDINFEAYIDRGDMLKAQHPGHPENNNVDLKQVITMHYCNEQHFKYLYHESIHSKSI